jgi:hypothetical protein
MAMDWLIWPGMPTVTATTPMAGGPCIPGGWVIKAFKENMPLTVWYLAVGEISPEATEEQITGFNRNHQITAEGVIDEEHGVCIRPHQYHFNRFPQPR